jgi:dynactin 1
VETLKQEKKALLELQQGGEGEKSSLLASSQKALSRAAQLVTDAAATRKREAQAVLDRIDASTYKHLSARCETLLPQNAVSAELSAIRGELLTAKVIGMASSTLVGISALLRKAIRPPLPPPGGQQAATKKGSFDLTLPDDVQQQITTMIHQTEFALVIAELSSDLQRFLAAGQWPEFLAPEASAELGIILGHSIPSLDNALGIVLKSLKEEGSLNVDQSNIGELILAIQSALQHLQSEVEREDSVMVPSGWAPPGWKLLKDASLSKFAFLGAASALSSAVDSLSDSNVEGNTLGSLYGKVEQCSSQAWNMCLGLANLDLQNERVIAGLTGMLAELASESKELGHAIQAILTSSGDISAGEEAVSKSLRSLAKITSLLRSENMNPREDERPHPLSPEVDDAWRNIASIARQVRSIDGDDEDINFIVRARNIENRIGEAVDNEPKLAFAYTKVASLEKSLASRSKEIAMQNARLSELENAVAKSSSSMGRAKAADLRSSEEYNALKEENRVVRNTIVELLFVRFLDANKYPLYFVRS